METQMISNVLVSKHYLWTGGFGIVLALFNSCLICCLVPQHNIITEPNFWYEFMTVSVFGFIGLFAAGFILNISVWMNLDFMCTWKNFLAIYLISGSAWISFNSAYYLVWTFVLSFRPPMPLNIHFCGILTLFVTLSSTWLLFPKHVRNYSGFSNRYIYFSLSQLFRNGCIWVYFLLARLFVVINPCYQWTLVIVLHLIREINGRLLTKLCNKAAACDKSIISITCQHEVGCRHAVFLCVALSLLATTSSSFLCLGFDFGVNLMLCIRIIWKHQFDYNINNPTTIENVRLQELALNEKVVYVVPLAYSICFLFAYYGPNARIIGNVKNDLWHFGTVEDISKPLYLMGLLFLMDFVSILLWIVLLKRLCKISFIDGFLQIQKRAWLIMAVQEAYALNEVKHYSLYSTKNSFYFTYNSRTPILMICIFSFSIFCVYFYQLEMISHFSSTGSKIVMKVCIKAQIFQIVFLIIDQMTVRSLDHLIL